MTNKTLLAIAVSLLGAAACSSSTVTTGDAGDAGEPGNTTGDAGSDGGSCAVNPQSGTATCDSCLATMCCSELVTCYGTDPAVTTACQKLIDCVQTLEAGDPDAGIAGMSMSDSFDACTGPDGGAVDGGAMYTASDATAARAMLECLGDGNTSANRCGASCGGVGP
jgi:hypothetical protein